jgi:hypothetical protein
VVAASTSYRDDHNGWILFPVFCIEAKINAHNSRTHFASKNIAPKVVAVAILWSAERASRIRVGRQVEANMAVADLQEREPARFGRGSFTH